MNRSLGLKYRLARGTIFPRVRHITSTGKQLGAGDDVIDGQTSTGQSNKTVDIPKPYLSKSVYGHRAATRRLNASRIIAQWKHDQEEGTDWPSQWPAQMPFDPHKVPLDIRAGAAQNMIPKPHKYGNLELMKIQNFLHLTTPAIKKHCEELKKFCTEWPTVLHSDSDCEREFPIEVHNTDYVHCGQTQRNSRARITKLKIRLCHLALDQHARTKLIKLVGGRYDPKSDVLTLVASRCPVRKQNREYLDYILTVLFYESWKIENWESRENIVDEDGIYWWSDSNSYKNLIRIFASHPKYRQLVEIQQNANDNSSIEKLPEVEAYRDAVNAIKMPGQDIQDSERQASLLQYKESVLGLLGLPKLP